jgi:O-antigen/teichoic acid export membrane protein
MKHSHTVAQNAAWLIAQPILVGVVSVVVTAWVARDLGTENYGTLLLLLSYAALFSQVSSLGLRPYSVREIAANRDRAVEIVSDMLVLRSLLAIVTILAALAITAFFDPIFTVPLSAALCAMVLLNALSGCFIDGLQGLERMKAVATSFAVSGVLAQLACLFALFMKLGLLGIASAYTISALVMLVMVSYQFFRSSGRFGARPPGTHLTTHLRRSWAFLLQNVLGTFRGRVDLILINGFLGAHAAGIYGSCMVLIQRIDQVQDGIGTAVFPRVAYLHGKAKDELITLVRGAIKVVLVISTPMAVGLAAVSHDVVALMFGKQYIESGPILTSLGFAIPFMFTAGIMFNVLRAMGLEKAVLKASIWATLLTVSAFFLGILLDGMRGAALAFVVSNAALAAILVVIYTRKISAPWLVADLLRIVCANAAMAAVLWLIGDQNLAIKIIVAAVIFAGMVTTSGLVTVTMLRNLLASRKKQ